MLTEYLEKAMKHAVYEEMEECGFFGHIRELKGPWAQGASKEECQADLRQVLEEWLVLALREDEELPEIEGVSLNFGGKRWTKRLAVAS
ncbi:MAG: type II toxin-antitoxin system HicB family antitoxin [Dehalococcoidia bacterium]|nr:type II toxin-antitoxin system HicB family antitoxin [Dehalococcoidia bacterium]